jgi:hypothetical protein
MIIFDDRHRIAAQSLATSPVIRVAARAAECSPSSVLRWRRLPEFQELIHAYTPEGREQQLVEAITKQKENLELIKAAEEDELLITADLQELIEKMLGILKKRLDGLGESEIQDIPIRLISPLMGVVIDATKLLQTSNDRLTGYGVVLAEIEKILEPGKVSNLN